MTSLHQQKTDRETMEDAQEWVMYPVLPIKRRRPDDPLGPECCVIAAMEPRWRVYKKGLYSLKSGALDDILGTDYYDYSSLDALLRDGWVVD